jgi:cell division protein FtsL
MPSPAAAAAAQPVRRVRTAPARTRTAPPRPRRVSGPSRQFAPGHAPQSVRAHGQAQAERGLVLDLAALLARVSSLRTLDSLIRSRLWIALIAFALIGIVTLQLLVLQMNASIGRALAHEGQLQRENATLSIEGSELASGERVESQAARLGMQLVPVSALRFLRSDPSADIARAAAALSKPADSSSSAQAGAEGSANTTSPAGTSASSASESTGTEQAASTSGAAADAPATGSSEASSATGATGAAASASTAGASAPATPASTPSEATAGGGSVAASAAAGAPAVAGGTEPSGQG